MAPLTIDTSNGLTISIAHDLNCLSVAAYPKGERGDQSKWHKFENGASDCRVYSVGQLIKVLQELSA